MAMTDYLNDMPAQGNRKVVLVGTGFVGMSMAYTLMNHKGIDELVLVDVNTEKAEGEAMDLVHGLPYASGKLKVYAGDYSDCADANVIVVTAGAAQKPGQTRLELVAINTKIMASVGKAIKESGFNGVIVVASNPCDIMTYVMQKATGLHPYQVLGSGTMLDTARLRYEIGNFFEVNPASVHGYIMGAHGDSSFVSWTNAYIGCKSLLEVVEERKVPFDQLQRIYEQVRDAAYEIINKKRATYYGIGMSLARLVDAILNNENTVLPLSCYLEGQYGHEGLYIGVPAIINRAGIREILTLPLTESDQEKFDRSCSTLQEIIDTTVTPILEGKE
ncbi:L-lactate dehydrogenase [uncultured Catenibacterium sp.]|uniref:L-lactate dehydrogenase n=1 Tax=uncultured Catenibacterium sp. TaxID=286142 RepID=UPI0025F22D5D|nr:L-lactate dehydrogenase [uncultured Catenibacterium sp.]